MKTHQLAIAACLLIAAVRPCSAMISVGILSKEEAAKLGITMQHRPNGDAGVKVWLEFKKEGFLEKFSYAELQMKDARGDHLLSAILEPHPVTYGQSKEIVSVAFSADPSQLERCAFMIVAYGSSRGDVGYVLNVKDFIDLANLAPQQPNEAESPIASPAISNDRIEEAIEAAEKRGSESAARDIKAGTLRILYFGEPWSPKKPLVDDETGYRVQIVAGCVVSEAFVAEVEAFNHAMRDWHARDTNAPAPLAPSPAPAADSTSNAVLTTVAAALEPVLAELDPRPSIDFPDGSPSLVVTHLPQTYKVHGRSKSGQVSTNVHDEVGPGFGGFVLRVHLQPKGEVNQACTPQTIREPYWQTDLDVTPIGGTGEQAYWALSYMGRTPTNVLAAIRAGMKTLETRR